MSTHPRSRTVRAISVCSLLFLAACGTSGDSTAEAATDSVTSPVTVENCGTTYTYQSPPTRAVTMNQHVTEIMLALGLEQSMVGTAYIDSTIRPDLVAAYDSVPVLAAQYPNREEVLAVDPDVIIGGYRSAFGDDAAGDRAMLLDSGISSYLTEGYCEDFEGRNTFDQVRNDITSIGDIFGVPDRATALVDSLSAPVEAASAAIGDAEPVTVFIYDSGTEKAFTAAGNEMTTELVQLAGGRNIFDDVDDTFTEVSWEDVIDRDPDVVLILNYGDQSIDEKQSFLASDPIASTLRAVDTGSYAVVDLTDVVPGIRNGDTVLALAQAFHPDDF